MFTDALAFLGSSATRSTSSSAAQPSASPGGEVGGLDEVWELPATHSRSAPLALAVAVADRAAARGLARPSGQGELLAIAVGNAGRAIPELALIAFMVAFVGLGLLNVTIALLILAIPPILTNAFVGDRQVDRDAVEAARGDGHERVARCSAGRAAAGGADDHERRPHLRDQLIATATIAPLAGVTRSATSSSTATSSATRACSRGRSGGAARAHVELVPRGHPAPADAARAAPASARPPRGSRIGIAMSADCRGRRPQQGGTRPNEQPHGFVRCSLCSRHSCSPRRRRLRRRRR